MENTEILGILGALGIYIIMFLWSFKKNKRILLQSSTIKKMPFQILQDLKYPMFVKAKGNLSPLNTFKKAPLFEQEGVFVWELYEKQGKYWELINSYSSQEFLYLEDSNKDIAAIKLKDICLKNLCAISKYFNNGSWKINEEIKEILNQNQILYTHEKAGLLADHYRLDEYCFAKHLPVEVVGFADFESNSTDNPHYYFKSHSTNDHHMGTPQVIAYNKVLKGILPANAKEIFTFLFCFLGLGIIVFLILWHKL